MNKVYSRINWENEPSTKTPLNEHNLNKIDFAVDEIDNRVIELDSTKAKNTDLQTLSTRVDNLILNAGDSSAECTDARVTEDGTTYSTLKKRLDAEHSQLSNEIIEASGVDTEVTLTIPSGSKTGYVYFSIANISSTLKFEISDLVNLDGNKLLGYQIVDCVTGKELGTFERTSITLYNIKTNKISLGAYFKDNVTEDATLKVKFTSIIETTNDKVLKENITDMVNNVTRRVIRWNDLGGVMFEIDTVNKTITTNSGHIIAYREGYGEHGDYWLISNSTTLDFELGVDGDDRGLPYYLIFDKKQLAFRLCGYDVLETLDRTKIYVVGYGSLYEFPKYYTFNIDNNYVVDGNTYPLADSDIIPIGTTTRRFENFSNHIIIGENKTGSILLDESGNYDTPPIEIAGGIVSNLTIKEKGGRTDHMAYCIHTDNNNNVDEELIIEDCILISNSDSCVGMGTRQGYKVTFRNCLFIQEGAANGLYMHNTSVSEEPPTDNPSEVSFINCTFISNDGACVRLQDWKSNTDTCIFTFINNTFTWNGDAEESVSIEYRNYNGDEIGIKEFKNKFSLSAKSCGNNVSWLNA